MSHERVNHGHVFPREDGTKSCCGGPNICTVCALDLARKTAKDLEERPVIQGLVCKPGDKVLITLTNAHISKESLDTIQKGLKERFPGVEFTFLGGATPLMVKTEDGE